MIDIRRAADRGRTRLPWLDSRHTFSFGEYYDPAHMGFRSLRVINDDRVDAGQGFGTHPHRDMEILTYVLEGALEHRDSLGNGSVIRPGELQRMTAGTGIRHSEFNASREDAVHFLQIWIEPGELGLPPGYEQRAVPPAAGDALALAASNRPAGGALTVHQDVAMYAGRLPPGTDLTHRLQRERHAWVHVARGAVQLNDQLLHAGDGAAVSGESQLRLHADDASEVLIFDLA
jgi:redox-sensitive bicupin YhaK (pirin superfamily)